jgi:hypothetical protein
VTIIISAVVLLAWIPLRQLPGLGTISNVILVGVSLNLALQWLPRVTHLAWRITDVAAGILLCGVATGMYIGAHYGPGPRDGLMTGLARRTGRSIRLVRTCIEVSVLIAGWALGGTVGIGTIAFAVAIGPLVHVFLPLFSRGSDGPGGSGGSDGSGGSGGNDAHGADQPDQPDALSHPRRRPGPARWPADRSRSRIPGARPRRSATGRPATRG